MLTIWIIIFAILAIVSGVLGFTRLSAAAGVIAKFLAVIFLFAVIALLIQGLFWDFDGL